METTSPVNRRVYVFDSLVTRSANYIAQNNAYGISEAVNPLHEGFQDFVPTSTNGVRLSKPKSASETTTTPPRHLSITPTDNIFVRGARSHEKRFDNARFSFYDAGKGLCGKTNSNEDFVVAMNSAQFAGGSHCFEMISIAFGGKNAQAQIVDECPGCSFGGLDFSRGLFDFFAPLPGPIFGSWVFAASPQSNAPPPSSKPAITATQGSEPTRGGSLPASASNEPPTSSGTPTKNGLAAMSGSSGTNGPSITNGPSTTNGLSVTDGSSGTNKLSASATNESPTTNGTSAPLASPSSGGPGFSPDEPEPTHQARPQGAIIGGALGGLVLLAALILCLFLYLRRKRNRSTFTTPIVPPRQHPITEYHNGTGTFSDLRDTRTRSQNAAETARNTIMFRISSRFRRQPVQSLIANPLEYSEDYLPPEDKRERLERVHREMGESRKQREILQLDLDSQSNGNNGLEVGLDREVEWHLRQQIEAMSRRIEELEADRQEALEAPPPDYHSSA